MVHGACSFSIVFQHLFPLDMCNIVQVGEDDKWVADDVFHTCWSLGISTRFLVQLVFNEILLVILKPLDLLLELLEIWPSRCEELRSLRQPGNNSCTDLKLHDSKCLQWNVSRARQRSLDCKSSFFTVFAIHSIKPLLCNNRGYWSDTWIDISLIAKLKNSAESPQSPLLTISCIWSLANCVLRADIIAAEEVDMSLVTLGCRAK